MEPPAWRGMASGRVQRPQRWLREEEPSTKQARARPRPRSTPRTPDSGARTLLLTPRRGGSHRSSTGCISQPLRPATPPLPGAPPPPLCTPKGGLKPGLLLFPRLPLLQQERSRALECVPLEAGASGLQEPDLGSEKQVGPFDTVKLVTGASEKQDKQTWAQEKTHSSFFPLPFTLIKGQYSSRCLTVPSRGLVVLFIVLSTSAGSPEPAGQWRPLSRSVDISGDLSGPWGLSFPGRARRREEVLAGFSRWAIPAGLSVPNRPGLTPPSCSTARSTQELPGLCGPVLLWRAQCYETF